VRSAISTFAKAQPTALESGLSELDLGYRIVIAARH
jgi:hypothetical protein